MPRPALPLLQADCSRCAALCCVLLPLDSRSGFGVDKAGGVPCHHLRSDDRCGIHDRLRPSGWPGCAAFDCFGAGQQATQVTYADGSWRDEGRDRGEMAAVLSVLRLLHESLHHLAEVARRSPAPPADALLDRITTLVALPPAPLLTLDLQALLDEVSAELRAASVRIRSTHRRRGADSPRVPGGDRPDLAGRDLRGHDLRGADLRGALLLAADLRDCDLTDTDLLGADLRDADVRGADLVSALFLTRPQVGVARGDRRTSLPQGYARPTHWD